MTLPGEAFLALWNDFDPKRRDYDFWHSREHVGERLGVPGILFARRYVEGSGALPAYFTLYGLENVAVLGSAPYRQLLSNPTSWSAEMRPGMRNFMRFGCRTAASLGGGMGGIAATALFTSSAGDDDIRNSLARIAPQRAFSSVHLGRVDESVAPVPFAASAQPMEGNAVLIFEGYEKDGFEQAVEKALADLATADLCKDASLGFYRLGFALTAADRDEMLPFRREQE